MLTLHSDVELVSGDDWEISGLLLDADGQPLNLVPTVLLDWVLLDPNGVRVPNLIDYASIERVDPVSSGRVLILVPDELTKTFHPGRFTNSIRAWTDGAASTLWRGLILVNANPFFSAMIP